MKKKYINKNKSVKVGLNFNKEKSKLLCVNVDAARNIVNVLGESQNL